MDPNVILRLISSGKIFNNDIRNLTFELIIKGGASPFYEFQGKTAFELACDANNLLLVEMFLVLWVFKPSWALFEEVYKLNKNKPILKYIDSVLLQFYNKHVMINQILNVLHVNLL